MREKNKIEKYLDTLIKKHNGTVSRSDRSSYYFVKGRVLRVSDHVGKNSTGNISIIFDNGDSDNYIIHGHSSGLITILNYKQLKEFVRNFVILNFIYNEMNMNNVSISEISKDVTGLNNKSQIKKELVTFLQTHFTKNQFNTIKNWQPKLFK